MVTSEMGGAVTGSARALSGWIWLAILVGGLIVLTLVALLVDVLNRRAWLKGRTMPPYLVVVTVLLGLWAMAIPASVDDGYAKMAREAGMPFWPTGRVWTGILGIASIALVWFAIYQLLLITVRWWRRTQRQRDQQERELRLQGSPSEIPEERRPEES